METVSFSTYFPPPSSIIRTDGAPPDMVMPAVNEDLVKGMVDLLVSSGLKKAGYSYFVIDGKSQGTS